MRLKYFVVMIVKVLGCRIRFCYLGNMLWNNFGEIFMEGFESFIILFISFFFCDSRGYYYILIFF